MSTSPSTLPATSKFYPPVTTTPEADKPAIPSPRPAADDSGAISPAQQDTSSANSSNPLATGPAIDQFLQQQTGTATVETTGLAASDPKGYPTEANALQQFNPYTGQVFPSTAQFTPGRPGAGSPASGMTTNGIAGGQTAYYPGYPSYSYPGQTYPGQIPGYPPYSPYNANPYAFYPQPPQQSPQRPAQQSPAATAPEETEKTESPAKKESESDTPESGLTKAPKKPGETSSRPKPGTPGARPSRSPGEVGPGNADAYAEQVGDKVGDRVGDLLKDNPEVAALIDRVDDLNSLKEEKKRDDSPINKWLNRMDDYKIWRWSRPAIRVTGRFIVRFLPQKIKEETKFVVEWITSKPSDLGGGSTSSSKSRSSDSFDSDLDDGPSTSFKSTASRSRRRPSSLDDDLSSDDDFVSSSSSKSKEDDFDDASF